MNYALDKSHSENQQVSFTEKITLVPEILKFPLQNSMSNFLPSLPKKPRMQILCEFCESFWTAQKMDYGLYLPTNGHKMHTLSMKPSFNRYSKCFK